MHRRRSLLAPHLLQALRQAREVSAAELDACCGQLGGGGRPLHVDLGSSDARYVRSNAVADGSRSWLGLGLQPPRADATPTDVGAAQCSHLDFNCHAIDALGELLDALVARGHALGSASVLFPRPWPKARHEARRLLSPALVECLGSRMVEGGRLLLASDAPAVIASAEQLFGRSPQWRRWHPPLVAAREPPFPPVPSAVASAAEDNHHGNGGRDGLVRFLYFEKATAGPRKLASKRSVDYLLEGESVGINRHLARFARAPYLPSLLAEPCCDSLLRRDSKGLRKELIEAFAAVEVLEKHVLRGRAPAVFVDLCSGKGFLALVLALEFPSARVIAVDKNTRIGTEFLEFLPSCEFVFASVTAPEFAARLGELVAQAAAKPPVPPNWAARAAADAAAAPRTAGEPPSLCVALGVHLCGALSPCAIELFGAMPALDALVLVPCCLDRRGADNELRARARLAKLDPHDAKVALLKEQLERVVGASNVQLVRDMSMRTHAGGQTSDELHLHETVQRDGGPSPEPRGPSSAVKNAILVACREGGGAGPGAEPEGGRAAGA